MKKRIYSIALALVLCLGLATTAFAGSMSPRSAPGFTLDEEGNLTIHDGQTMISAYDWNSNQGIKTVTIADSVKRISFEAFGNCPNLTTVNLGNGVVEINDYAFYNCPKLTTVTGGGSVADIGKQTFSKTPWQTQQGDFPTLNGILLEYQGTETSSVTIPDTVKGIGGFVFYNRTDLTAVTLPAGLTYIGERAFGVCKITEITIPDSVTDIGLGAFDSCTALTTVNIGSGVEHVGAYAFNNTPWLSSKGDVWVLGDTLMRCRVGSQNGEQVIPTIPDNVTKIGDGAFANYNDGKYLTSFTVPDGVTEIGEHAFTGCTSLTEIHIPQSVTRMELTTLPRSGRLTAIVVDENNPQYSSKDGALYNKDGTELLEVPSGVSGTFAIPAGVTSIGESAFEGCKNLTEVTIPDGVTSIGNYGFYNCTSLTKITIPASVTSIGHENVFFGTAEGFTIYGVTGSEAEAFANRGNYTFVSIGGGTDDTETEETTLPTPDENGVITLDKDLVLSDTWVITEHVTLNLNGKTISSSGEIWNEADKKWALISVRGENGDLTINGDGTLQTIENDCYAVDIQQGGACTINGGTYVGNVHAVYVHTGTLKVTGGEFSIQQHYQDETKAYEFTLNCYDDSRANGTATITVSGGTFYQFDPSDNYAEGPGNSFVEEGCYSIPDGDHYTVYNTLDAAITAAPDGSEIKLSKDVAGQVVIPAGKNITLDLNGKKIAYAGGAAIWNNGTLTIKDSSAEQTGEINGNTGVAAGDNSTTVIESGKITSVEGAVITGYSQGAAIEIRGGALSASDNAVVAGNGNRTNHSGEVRTTANTITISGGTFTGGIVTPDYVACGVYAPWKDEITITGGTFNITGGAGVVARAGTVTITGGTFHCTGNTTGKVGDSRIVVPCSALVFDAEANYPAMDAASTISVTDGIFTAEDSHGTVYELPEGETSRISLTGGQFSSDVNAYAADGFEAVESNGAWTVAAAAPAAYPVTVTKSANGAVSADKETAAEGDTVTLTVTPDPGYQLDSLTVTGPSGAVTVSNNTFTMPAGDVTVTAAFTAIPTPPPTRPTTTTTTEKNEDGSVTTTTTNRVTGTVTETTKNPDGSSTVVETKRDGTVTTTEKAADGSTAKTVAKADGSSQTEVRQADGTTATVTTDAQGNTRAQVAVSGSAVAAAKESGETVALPIPAVTVPAADAGDAAAPTVAITVPTTEEPEKVKVEIPVESVTPGTVAVLVHEDGAEEVVRTSYVTENGLVVPVAGDVTVRIVDNSKQFEDMTDEHWAKGNVDFASSRELFKGVTETAFMPEAPMTRAMLVTVLARIEGVKPESETLWYGAAMDWAVELGITDGTYADDAISREQLATMLYRYYGKPQTTGDLSQFIDGDDVSPYAADAMKWAAEKGIVQGKGGGFLDPLGRATRAEVAAMLERCIERN